MVPAETIVQRALEEKVDMIGLSGSADFKTWYHDPHSAAGKKVATQLRKQLGISQYNRLNKQADESYSTRGHLAMYKSLSGTPAKTPAGAGSTGRTKKDTVSGSTGKTKKK